ncbi:unnamed protein product [Caenorhabditis brenneri]
MESSDDAPSRLLTLPADLQQEIFGYLSPIDIEIFSFCSKSSFQVAKCVKKPQKIEMNIELAKEGCVRISYPPQGRFLFSAFHKDKDNIVGSGKTYNQVVGKESGMFVMKDTHNLTTYWNDEIQGLLDFVKHLVEVFGIVLISTVQTNSSYGKRQELTSPEHGDIQSAYNYRLLLDWLQKEYKGEVDELIFETIDQTNNSELIYLLDAGKIAKRRLDFYTYLSPNLDYQFNYDFRELKICSGNWIKFDNLVQLSHQVRSLNIFKSSFTSLCLNQFIKKWLKSGEDLKLKTLSLHFRGNDVDMEQVLSDIEHQKFEGKDHYFLRKEKSFIKKGWVIRRRIKNDKLIIPGEVHSPRSLMMYIAPFKKGRLA